MKDKKLVILSTGGTIAMKYDAAKESVVPAVTGKELVEAVPPLEKLPVSIEVIEYSNIPSPHVTPNIMFEISQKIDEILQEADVAGVVVTHGTDTLEETAYFLDLAVESPKPVCITGAMRSSGEISPDGPKNLLAAARTALTSEAENKGTLVVMNDEIHSARDVEKTHTANVKTFSSPGWGPIGYVDEDQVIIKQASLKKDKIKTSKIVEDVHLVKLAAGSDDTILQSLVEKEVKGIVIEGLGRGNVPLTALPGIKKAIQKEIPVILTSRVTSGRVLDIYGYEGAGKPLKELGVISGGELSGQKARLKLMLALGALKDADTEETNLEEFFLK